MTKKLNPFDSEFKTQQYVLLHLIDDEETLQKEQDAVDKHVTALAVQVQQLIANHTSDNDSSSHKIVSQRIANLQKNLPSVSTAIGSLSGESDVCLLCQYEEQLSDFKKE